MKYQITQQSKDLLKEWNAEIVEMLNASYALASDRCTELATLFNGHIYSRIHRRSDGVTLMLEERVKGQMYPVCYLLKQDFSELEEALKNKEALHEELKEAAKEKIKQIEETPTPVKDAFVLRTKGIDKDKVCNGSEELKAGDYARTSNVAGFVKKVNPKSVIIETLYGGYAGSDAELMELKINRADIVQHLKPLN